VIALAATGLDATEIAKHLNLAAVSVRQELSKCYKVLIPNPKPGTDLRTAAVLKYLRDTRTGLD
jgi:DNA-binding NarL/FixJ family response regulator